MTEIFLGPFGMQSPWPHRRPHVDMYADLVAQAQRAEALGFDGIALTEHSFWYDGYCPSLLPALAAVAQHTTRLKLMTGALLVPQHDPLKVAEEAAVLDRLCGGRLVLGFGAGYRPEEFLGHGVPEGRWGARFLEAVEAVEAALTHETFSYEGEFYRYDGVTIPTRPAQSPPPIWACGGYTDWMAKAAGRRGWAYCSTGGVAAADFSVYDAYRGAAEAAGRDPAVLRRGLFRDVMVMPSEPEAKALAEEDYWPAMKDQFIGFGFLKNILTNPDGSPLTDLPDAFKDMTLGSQRNPVGTPPQVREMLAPVKDARFDLLLLRTSWANFKADRAFAVMETLAAEIVPWLREAAAPAHFGGSQRTTARCGPPSPAAGVAP